MSLNWSITKVVNHEEIHPSLESREGWITNSIIWATLNVGLGKIDAKNVDEWFYRLSNRPWGLPEFHDRDGNTFFLSKDDLTRRIGLSTNADTVTRKKWEEKMKKLK